MSAAAEIQEMDQDPDPVVELPEFLLKQLRDLHGRMEFCTGQPFTLTLVSHTKEVRKVVIGRPEDRLPVDPQYVRPKILTGPAQKKRKTK